MRIIADVMLQKLARWLRLAGIRVYDTPYIDDIKLIKYTKALHGVLLTMDTGLTARAEKNKVKVVLVKGKNIAEQLAFVAKALKLRISTNPSGICPYCNSKLIRVDKAKVLKYLPKNVAERKKVFYKCPKCKRVYWKGTHWDKISAVLKQAIKMEKKMKENAIIRK